MPSLLPQTLRYCCSKLVVLLCSIGICCPCLADLWGNSSRFEHEQFRLRPIHLMDDKTLIASAKTRRDERMCQNSRLFNAFWLNQNDRNTWHGNAAINRIVRRGVQQYLGTRSNANQAVAAVSQSELTYIGKYAVNISEEKVLVGVKFEF